MICPNCNYVFVPPKQPPGLAARTFCPRCRHLYIEREPDWHVMPKRPPLNQDGIDKMVQEYLEAKRKAYAQETARRYEEAIWGFRPDNAVGFTTQEAVDRLTYGAFSTNNSVEKWGDK